MKRRIGAVVLLFLLIVVPFLNWRLGAVMWMSAWMVFILQKLFDRPSWKFGEKDDSAGGDGDNNQE